MKKLFLLIILFSQSVFAQDFDKPTLTSGYTTFPGEIRANVNAVGKMDFTGASNIPTGFIRLNQTDGSLESYNGSTWDVEAIDEDGIADAAVTNSKAGFTFTAWTPTVTDNSDGSVTISNVDCEYQEVGEVFHFHCSFDVSTTIGSATYLKITAPSGVTLVKGQGMGMQIDSSDGSVDGSLYVSYGTSTKFYLYPDDGFLSTGGVYNFFGIFEVS